MTVRSPLVLVNGRIEELPASDVILGAPTGPTGATGMTWQGAWNSTTTYQVNDGVSNNGSSYIAIAINTNQAPPNATYWNLIASKGDTGATGATGSTGATGPAGSNGTNGALSQLAQIVTASSQTTVDFQTISGSFNALKIIYFARDTTAGTSGSNMRVYLNNDTTAANYSATSRIGSQNGTAFATTVASSTKGVEIGFMANDGNSAGMFSTGEVDIIGYASTTPHKRITGIADHEDGTSNGLVATLVARWKSTSAVTRVTFATDGTAFKDGSVFTLYGF